MECGGSDGNSGVTANPALGVAADLVVAQGGTAVLGETTEIYGAEHLLTRRAVSREVGEKLVERIKWWEWYAGVFGAEINNNPSPGNKAGGLTTIYEKSLGALAKAGSTPLVDVVGYAERVDTPGLVFMDTPGYDPPCTTGLVAGGANVLVFTTGRGSVLGLKPTPCIKVATNTPMYERMSDDMDLNAGTILEGEPVESVGRRIFELILEVASGPQDQERAQRSRRGGVRPLAHRAGPLKPRRRAPPGCAADPGRLLEAAWLGWFLVEPLPNAGQRRRHGSRRWMLLAKALPQVVPGVRFEQSYLGLAVGNLGHVENLPQRAADRPRRRADRGVGAGAGKPRPPRPGLHRLPGPGRAHRRWRSGSGRSGLGVIDPGRGTARPARPLADPGRARAARSWSEGLSRSSDAPARRDARPRIVGPSVGPGAARVRARRRAVRAGDGAGGDAADDRLRRDRVSPARAQGVFPGGPDHVPAAQCLHEHAVRRGDAPPAGHGGARRLVVGALVGQLLVAAFAPVAAALVALTARRWASPRAAWVAAVVYLTTPWVYRLAVLPYVEGPLCFYHAALVWAAARAWSGPAQTSGARLWAVAGLLAGGAMACKYPALISAVIPFGLLALVAAIRRSVRDGRARLRRWAGRS